MKNSLPGRLEFLLADLGMNRVDFCQKTGFGQSYISQIMNGSRSNPSIRFFDIVCREFNVSPEWLKSGKGEIYALPDGDREKKNAEIMAKFNLLPESEQRIIEDLVNALLMKAGNKEQKTESKKSKK